MAPEALPPASCSRGCSWRSPSSRWRSGCGPSGGPVARLRTSHPALLGLEKTTELVTSGVYRYIRHPLYTSLLLLAWGAFLKAPGRRAGGLAGVASALLFVTARVEERENVGYFGAAYEAYMRRTRRFIPFGFSETMRPHAGRRWLGVGAACRRGWTALLDAAHM